MRRLTRKETNHIVANALQAARRSILSDLASLLLVPYEGDLHEMLVIAAAGPVHATMENAIEQAAWSLRPGIGEEPPAAVVRAIVAFCAESPREMRLVMHELQGLLRCDKATARAFVRNLERKGLLRNLGNERHHRWVASSSRWGRPERIPSAG